MTNLARLTLAQRAIVALLAGGYTEKEVARMLTISPHTVHWQVNDAHRRLSARSAAQLVLLATLPLGYHYDA